MDQSRGTVLVTGGAGYVGSHACKALAKAGYLPVTYDNLVTGHPWAVKWGPFEEGNILDLARLDEVIRKHRPDAVMHFAAFANVGESVTNPGKYYRNNVAGSLKLLEAMHTRGIDRIVFSSTAAIYGTPEQMPVHESAVQCPINPYGVSKQVVERMLVDFARAHGLKWAALRYFNAAGADPEGEIGQLSKGTAQLIPLVLEVALGRRANITIYGTNYPTLDGTCVRDYVHVSDLAEGHVRVLDLLAAGRSVGAFNLGTGRGFSVREVIAIASRVTGREIPVINGDRRLGDPAVMISDPTRAQVELGWRPRFHELSAVVETAWAWNRTRSVLCST